MINVNIKVLKKTDQTKIDKKYGTWIKCYIVSYPHHLRRIIPHPRHGPRLSHILILAIIIIVILAIGTFTIAITLIITRISAVL